MKNYTMNFSTKTLTMTKEFATNAMIPNSEESLLLLHLQSICPNLNLAYKSNKTTAKNPRKGLTFEKMEKYIRLYDNANELLVAFSTVKAIGDVMPNKYEYVYKWFVSQFPNYKEMPELVNGKLVAEVISFPKVATVSITEPEIENTFNKVG